MWRDGRTPQWSGQSVGRYRAGRNVNPGLARRQVENSAGWTERVPCWLPTVNELVCSLAYSI
jgi:hypothetical protein